jgi:hypothetical protein
MSINCLMFLKLASTRRAQQAEARRVQKAKNSVSSQPFCAIITIQQAENQKNSTYVPTQFALTK